MVQTPINRMDEQPCQEWRIDGILWRFSVPITKEQAEQIVGQIRTYHPTLIG